MPEEIGLPRIYGDWGFAAFGAVVLLTRCGAVVTSRYLRARIVSDRTTQRVGTDNDRVCALCQRFAQDVDRRAVDAVQGSGEHR